MKTFDDSNIDWEAADPDHFTGAARIKRSAILEGEYPVKIYRVQFQAGARTHWHVHTGMQILLVTEGRCRVQKAEGEIREMTAGSGAFILPGEKHWHGAAADSTATHLAINLNASTTWMEPVKS